MVLVTYRVLRSCVKQYVQRKLYQHTCATLLACNTCYVVVVLPGLVLVRNSTCYCQAYTCGMPTPCLQYSTTVYVTPSHYVQATTTLFCLRWITRVYVMNLLSIVLLLYTCNIIHLPGKVCYIAVTYNCRCMCLTMPGLSVQGVFVIT